MLIRIRRFNTSRRHGCYAGRCSEYLVLYIIHVRDILALVVSHINSKSKPNDLIRTNVVQQPHTDACI